MSNHSAQSRPTGRQAHPRDRRGVGVVLVLGLLAVSMALSYAALRTQFTAVKLQDNSDRLDEARAAAECGLAIALRRMHEAGWAGVSTSLSGTLSNTQGYSATYETGDSSLQSTDADYSDWPWRVTIHVTGTARDTATGNQSSHRLRAVVRFVPRQLATQPSGWDQVAQYTVLQTAVADFRVNTPVRFEGNVRMQGNFSLSEDYGWSATTRTLYFGSLNDKYVLQGIDWRPFTGRIDSPTGAIGSALATLLTTMGVPRQTVPAATIADWSFTGSEYKYRLYPGGQEYAAQPVGNGTVTNTTYAADPKTNPVGILVDTNAVAISHNVNLNGTVLAINASGITLSGNSVQIRPVDLPPLQGTSDPVRLPTIVCRGDLTVTPSTGMTLVGLVSLGGDLDILQGSQSRQFDLQGKLVAKEIRVRERTEWISANMGLLATTYNTLLATLNGMLFCDWLKSAHGLDSEPKIRFRPGTPATYHWSPTGGSIFVPHTADEGLRWELVSVREE